MTDLRTEIQSAIMDHIHEVRGVAALTDAIMRVVEKEENTLLLHLAYIRQKSGVGMRPMLSELADAIAERIASARSDALEDAAIYVERIAHQGLHASMWRNMFKQVSDAIRAMKDKP